MYSQYTGNRRGSMLFTVNLFLWILVIGVMVPTFLLGADFSVIEFLLPENVSYAKYRSLVFLLIVASIMNLMAYSFFMASENVKLLQLSSLVRMFFGSSVVVAALYLVDGDTVWIRLKYIMMVELVLGVVLYSFLIRGMKSFVDFRCGARAMKMGLPVMFGAISSMLYGLGDRFVLTKYTGFDDIAIYNLGLTLASVMAIVMASFQSVYVPLFFKEQNVMKNYQSAMVVLRNLCGGLVVAAVGIQVLFHLLIETNMVDVAYQPTSTILPLLLVAAIFQALKHVFSNFLVYFEKTYIQFLIGLVANISNIGLNFLFVPRYGLRGAAFSTLIVSVVSVLVNFLIVKMKVKQMEPPTT